MLLTLSGTFASAGEDCRRGIEAALAVAGSAAPLQVVFADSKNDPTTAISEFQRLVKVEHVAAIYTHRSSIGMALNPISLAMQVPLLGAVGHKNFAGTNSFALQIWPRSDDEGRFVADQFAEHGYKRSALIYTEDEWTTSVSEGFRHRMAEHENKLLLDQAVLPGESDFRTLLLQLKARNPDAVYMNLLLPQITPILRQARQQRLAGRFYFNFYVAKKEVADDIGAGLLEGVSYVEPDSDLPTLKAKLNNDGESPPGLTLASYLATLLAAQVLTENGKLRTPKDFQAALLNQQELRTPDHVYPIENRYMPIPLVVKTMEQGVWVRTR